MASIQSSLARFFVALERCRAAKQLTLCVTNRVSEKNDEQGTSAEEMDDKNDTIESVCTALCRLTRVQSLQCHSNQIPVTPLVAVLAPRLHTLKISSLEHDTWFTEIPVVFNIDVLSTLPALTCLDLRMPILAFRPEIERLRNTLRKLDSLCLACVRKHCCFHWCTAEQLLGEKVEEVIGDQLSSLTLITCAGAQHVLNRTVDVLARRRAEDAYQLRALWLQTHYWSTSSFTVQGRALTTLVKAHPLLARLTLLGYSCPLGFELSMDLEAACLGIREQLMLRSYLAYSAVSPPTEGQAVQKRELFPQLSASLQSLAIRKITPALFPCAHFRALLELELGGPCLSDADLAALARAPCAVQTLEVLSIIAFAGNHRLTSRALYPFVIADAKLSLTLRHIKWLQIHVDPSWSWEAFLTTIGQLRVNLGFQLRSLSREDTVGLVDALLAVSGDLVGSSAKIKSFQLYPHTQMDSCDFATMLGIAESDRFGEPYDVLASLRQSTNGS